MGLSSQERERLEQEHLKLLQQRDAERELERAAQLHTDHDSGVDSAALEPDAIEAEIERVKADVESRYFSARGYKRYVDHNRKVLWLTPSEYEARAARRDRKHKKENRERVRQERMRIGTYVAIACLAAVIGYLLAR